MKIQVVIPLWRRPEVTKFCFDRLRKLIAESKHEIEVTCVLSEDEFKPLCDAYGFEWCYYDNEPLGAKINAGILVALWHGPDYIMMMNSDDVIEAELLDKWYEPYFEKRNPFFGINRVTYVKFGTEEARDITYDFSVLGIGKCILADAAKRVKNLYRPELNKGLDDTMMDNMIRAGCNPIIVPYAGMLAMDFKSEVNIWPWERFENKGTKVCYNRGYALENWTVEYCS